MTNYRYKGTVCGDYFEHFVVGLKSPDEDKNHDAYCSCGIEVCTQIRVMSKPQQPMGFKVWAGDWHKKTYGREIGERDLKYADKQKKLDESARELKRNHNIQVREHKKD